MNKFAVMLLALVLFPTDSSATQSTRMVIASAATSAQTESGRVYVIGGSVFVAQGKNTAHRVTDNEVIASDTLIYTGDNSSALLKFADGQIVAMQASSTFQVREYHYDASNIENSVIVFSMLKGGIRFVTGLIGQQGKRSFRLLTPYATIGIRGTDFMVAMLDNALYSQVITGKVAMTNAAGMTMLNAGQSAVVASTGALATVVSAANIPPATFSQLLSLPVQPSAIPAPALAPTPVTVPAPVTVSVPVPVPVAVPATVPTTTVADIKSKLSDSTKAAPQPAPTVAGPQDSIVRTEQASKKIATEPAAIAHSQTRGIKNKSGMGVTGKAGTLGFGGEFNIAYSDFISSRFGVNSFVYKYNANSSAVNYDFKLSLQTISALADWYPLEGGFRTSAGLLYNNNEVSLSANPTGGNFTIGANTYPTSQVATLQGVMSFNKLAPYIGIGWGNPVAKDKGWGLVTDIGILFQGRPKIDLTVTCTSACPATLQNDAIAENARLHDDQSKFKWWPVVSIGISYQW